MKQLFEVGEVVIMQHSGEECVVGEVTFEEATEITGRPGLHAGFYYRVGILAANGNDKWTQSSLRKKQQPSELSFKSLMNSLKSPVLEWK